MIKMDVVSGNIRALLLSCILPRKDIWM